MKTELLNFEGDLKSSEVRNLIESGKFSGLQIFNSPGRIVANDLEFLPEFDFLTQVRVCSHVELDLTPLKSLKRLENLCIELKNLSLTDFSCFEQLKYLSLSLSRAKKFIHLGSAIERLFLQEVKDNNLEFILNLDKITELTIKSSSLKSIAGFSRDSRLKSLQLGGVRGLVKIEGELPSTLKSLFLDGLSNLTEVSAIGIENLESLEITDCGKIKSIIGFEKCLNLRNVSLWGRTNILDGDVAFLNEVQTVRGVCLPHYNFQF